MRIAVVGAGAIGGTFAALLARAGHEVTVTARGEALALIDAGGIRLTGGFGDIHARPAVLAGLVERPDLTLVCTKAHEAEDAVRQNARAMSGSPVIIVQNGLDGVALAEGLLPGSDCFGGLSLIAANYTAPGEVRVTTAAPTYLGRGRGPVDAATRRWQAALDDAVPCVAVDNFAGAQWSKLVVNMLNALPAATGMSVQEVVGHRDLRLVLTAAMRETVRVGMARGVTFGSLQGLSDARLRRFARLPLWAGQVLPYSMRARMGPVPNLGSTLQSLRRGQHTEIDHLNGVVVREAASAGIRAPVNALLTQLVHDVEASGRSYSPHEVTAAFRARLG